MAQTHKQFLAQAAKRRATAVRLNKNGKTQREIAAKLGISQQRVGKILKFEASKAKA